MLGGGGMRAPRPYHHPRAARSAPEPPADLFAPWTPPPPRPPRAAPQIVAQACLVCGRLDSPFGYGLPPSATLWACLGHRALAELRHVDEYVPMARTGRPKV